MMSLCRDLASYRRGIEWSDAARRWLERQPIRGLRRDLPDPPQRALADVGQPRRGPWRSEPRVRRGGGIQPGARGRRTTRARRGTVAARRPGGSRGRVRPRARARRGPAARARAAAARARRRGRRRSRRSAAASKARRTTGSLVPACWRPRRRSPVAAADAERAMDAQRRDSSSSPNRSRLRRCAPRADGRKACSPSLEDDPETASRHLREARDRWSAVSAPYEAAKAEVALAEAELLRGDRDAAADELQICPRQVRTARREAGRSRRGQLWRSGSGGEDRRSRTVRTFLFTDIVGSTSLIGVIGDDAWDDLRRWHDQTLRASFVDHGGEEIDHAGDGFFVAFPDVTTALASAVEIQRRLAEHRRAHGFAPQVRMGAPRDHRDARWDRLHRARRPHGRQDQRVGRGGRDLASVETIDEVPDVRGHGAAHRAPEGHRRAGRRHRGRVARLTLG